MYVLKLRTLFGTVSYSLAKLGTVNVAEISTFINSVVVGVVSLFESALFSWQIVEAIMWQNTLMDLAWGNFDLGVSYYIWESYQVWLWEQNDVRMLLRCGCKCCSQKAQGFVLWVKLCMYLKQKWYILYKVIGMLLLLLT